MVLINSTSISFKFQNVIICYLYMIILWIIGYIMIWNFIELLKLNLLLKLENIKYTPLKT